MFWTICLGFVYIYKSFSMSTRVSKILDRFSHLITNLQFSWNMNVPESIQEDPGASLSAEDCEVAEDTLAGACIKKHVACMTMEIDITQKIAFNMSQWAYWFPWFLGPLVPLVPRIPWFPWLAFGFSCSSGSSGAPGPLVPWFHRFLVQQVPSVRLVLLVALVFSVM